MNTKPGSDLLYLHEKIGEFKEYIEDVIENYEWLINLRIDTQANQLSNSILKLSEDLNTMVECGNEIIKLLKNLGEDEIVDNERERSYYDGDREDALKTMIRFANCLYTYCDLRSMSRPINNIKGIMFNFDYIMS